MYELKFQTKIVPWIILKFTRKKKLFTLHELDLEKIDLFKKKGMCFYCTNPLVECVLNTRTKGKKKYESVFWFHELGKFCFQQLLILKKEIPRFWQHPLQ